MKKVVIPRVATFTRSSPRPISRKYLYGSITLLLFGALLIAVGIALPFVIIDIVGSQLAKSALTPVPSDGEGYASFVSNNRSDAPITLYDSYIYNVTNVEEILATGALPKVQMIGPYVFRKYTDLLSVTYTFDQSFVEYGTYDRFVFVPELSQGTERDVLNVYNPIWDMYLSQTDQAPEIILLSGAGALLQTIFTTLLATNDTFFTSDMLYQQWGSGDYPGLESGVSTVLKPQGVSLPFIMEYALYVNDTTYNFSPESSQIITKGLAADLDSPILGGNPMLSGLNGRPGSLALMSLCGMSANPATQATAIALLGTVFSVEQGWGYSAMHWIKLCGYLQSEIIGKAMPWSFPFLKEMSVLYPDPTRVGNPFPYNIGSGRWSRLTPRQVLFYHYDSIAKQEISLFGSDASLAEAQHKTDAGITTRIGTGYGDLSNLDRIIKSKGVSTFLKQDFVSNGQTKGWCGGDYTIDGLYNPNLPPAKANGINLDRQFSLDDHPILYVSEIKQNVPISYEQEVTVKGVKAYRYRVDTNAVLGVNPFFNRTIHGIGNLVCPTGGLPLLYHYPGLYGASLTEVEATWKLADGFSVFSEPAPLYIDIEGNSGKSIRAALSLGISANLKSGFPGHPQNQTLLPMIWITKHGELTDDQAKKLQTVKLALLARTLLLGLGIPIGGVCLVGCFFCWRKYKAQFQVRTQ